MRRLAVALAGALALACGGRKASPPPSPPPQETAFTEAEILSVSNPHSFQGKPFCLSCHAREQGPELRYDPITTCRRCHDFPHASHPVNMDMQREPGALPLSGRRVVCYTCHQPHDLATWRGGLRMEFNQLCVQCHRKGGGKDHHADHATKGRGHPLPPAGGKPGAAHEQHGQRK